MFSVFPSANEYAEARNETLYGLLDDIVLEMTKLHDGPYMDILREHHDAIVREFGRRVLPHMRWRKR